MITRIYKVFKDWNFISNQQRSSASLTLLDKYLVKLKCFRILTSTLILICYFTLNYFEAPNKCNLA